MYVGSSVGTVMEGKFWQWQGRGEGRAAREMETMEKLHNVHCPGSCPTCRWTGLGSTMPAGDKRYKLVVPVLTIASHHSAPPALSHWQNRIPSGICCPSSPGCTFLQAVTACLRSTLAGLALTSSADTCEGRGSTSTAQASSIHPRAGRVLTSFTLWSIGCSHSLLTSQWLSKKVRMSAAATSAPRTRERISPTRRKGQQRSRRGRKGNSWASFRKNTLCGHYRGRAGDSPVSHLHQEQRAALAGHILGTVRWALPAHNEWPLLSLLSMTQNFHLAPCSSLPALPTDTWLLPACSLYHWVPCCLHHQFPMAKFHSLLFAFLTAHLLYSHLSFILPSRDTSLALRWLFTFSQTIPLCELNSDCCLSF